MLKLTYARKNDKHQKVTVLGDDDDIRDLYWQLTHNYKAKDTTTIIGNIVVCNLDGEDVTQYVLARQSQMHTELY